VAAVYTQGDLAYKLLLNEVDAFIYFSCAKFLTWCCVRKL